MWLCGVVVVELETRVVGLNPMLCVMYDEWQCVLAILGQTKFFRTFWSLNLFFQIFGIHFEAVYIMVCI
jgi:hypothetical protein